MEGTLTQRKMYEWKINTVREKNEFIRTKNWDIYTVRNFRKLTEILYYKGNLKFDDIYDLFE